MEKMHPSVRPAENMHGPETGHRVEVGGEFGHEMVSGVVQAGKNVKNIHVGDRVYPYPRLAKGDPKRAGTVGIAI